MTYLAAGVIDCLTEKQHMRGPRGQIDPGFPFEG